MSSRASNQPSTLALLSLVAAALLLLGAGCGARSQLNERRDGRPPGTRRDGGGGNGRLDGNTAQDLLQRDSCLPLPASAVQGSYAGTWRGTYRCAGQSAVSVNGTLSFRLSPAGAPESFNVSGTMTGRVDPGFPFSTNISGRMTCTSLVAQLPRILVGSGTIVFEGRGSFNGGFVASPRSFPSGSWTGTQNNSTCSASGTWQATRAN